MKKLSLIFFAVTLLAGISANAADVTIAPPAGGSFVVKSNDGASDRFKVTETGQVYIPTLPAALAGKPLCWDQATGLLQTCPDAIGHDSMPPTIDTVSLTVASRSPTDLPVSFSDNVELAWYTTKKNGIVHLFDEGVKAQQTVFHLSVPLGGASTDLISLSDTSGNLAKKSFTISAPATNIKFGTYKTIGSVYLPANFGCMSSPFQDDMLNNAIVNEVFLSLGSFWGQTNTPIDDTEWTTADGFRLGMRIRWGNQSFGFNLLNSTLQPLNASVFQIDSIPLVYGGGWSEAYVGQVKVLATVPSSVEISINKKCLNNNASWINGGIAVLTAELVP